LNSNTHSLSTNKGMYRPWLRQERFPAA
jgi:hypothetical protein